VDTHSAFEDGILSLSLGADVVMEFRRAHGAGGEPTYLLSLPRRSLLVLRGVD
jgi:alkylated DNA repair protein alkB family protein 8